MRSREVLKGCPIPGLSDSSKSIKLYKMCMLPASVEGKKKHCRDGLKLPTF